MLDDARTSYLRRMSRRLKDKVRGVRRLPPPLPPIEKSMRAETKPVGPDAAERAALAQIPFLRRLTGPQRQCFFELSDRFLATVTITPLDGTPPTTEERALIAGSCALLYAGRPDWPFPPVDHVFLSNANFDETDLRPSPEGRIHGFYQYSRRNRQKAVWFVRAAVKRSYDNTTDGLNVPIHEFAHTLDSKQGACDGIPTNLPGDLMMPWLHVLKRAFEEAGEPTSALRGYGRKHKGETFAVALEAFFERPIELRRRNPEIYVLLCAILQQDPADYDEQNEWPQRLAGSAEQIIEQFLTSLEKHSRIRQGKLYWDRLPGDGPGPQVMFVTDSGDWSEPASIRRLAVEKALRRAPRDGALVALTLADGKPERVWRHGRRPSVLPWDYAELTYRLHRQLPEVGSREAVTALQQAADRLR